MVARRKPQGHPSSHHAVAGAAIQFTGDDVSGPSIKPIDNASSGTDLPAEDDNDRERDQGASDHDSDGDSHQIKYTASGMGYEKVPPINEWCPNLVASQREGSPPCPLPPTIGRNLVPWMQGIGIEAWHLLIRRFRGRVPR
jgi:hypothetical protein